MSSLRDLGHEQPVPISFKSKETDATNIHPAIFHALSVAAWEVWGQLGAIFKDSPHPNAAKLYLEWYMAKEQQNRIGTWSARTDVPPPFGLKPIFDYKVANDLADIVTNPTLLADLRKRFEGFTGEIKNPGGIR